MGQFDFPSAAALAQIKNDALTTSPVEKAVSSVVGIGSKILELAGFVGAAKLTDLIRELKSLAANKDEANLIYFGETLVDDIGCLYKSNDEMRKQFDELLKSTEFHEAVANATLHITRTNVAVRLERVSLLIANGVKAQDLEPESLDDMMRAAVELTNWDIVVLGKMYKSQAQFLAMRSFSHDWSTNIGRAWGNWGSIFGLREDEHLKLRAALSRLESHGLIAEAQTNFVKDGTLARQPFGLLPDGAKLYERLQEIAVKKT